MKFGTKIGGGKRNTVSRAVRIARGNGAYRGWFHQLNLLHAHISKTGRNTMLDSMELTQLIDYGLSITTNKM